MSTCALSSSLWLCGRPDRASEIERREKHEAKERDDAATMPASASVKMKFVAGVDHRDDHLDQPRTMRGRERATDAGMISTRVEAKRRAAMSQRICGKR